MATKKKAKTTTPTSSANKWVGYFYWMGDYNIDEVVEENGISYDALDLETAREKMEDDMNLLSCYEEGYVYKVTVERVLKTSKGPITFTKVE